MAKAEMRVAKKNRRVAKRERRMAKREGGIGLRRKCGWLEGKSRVAKREREAYS
jgi:hypothetical protein